MNKSGIIYLFVSVAVVLVTAFFALTSQNAYNDDITITVMNTAVLVSENPTETSHITQTTETTAHKKTTSYSVTAGKITTTLSETAFSSFSPNTEPVTTSAEPIETVTELVTEEVFIDINSADVQELMKLNGIGEVIAGEIISYREQNGSFSNIEEIMNVSGIGSAKFENIRSYIYVQNPVYYTEEVPEEIPVSETEPEIIPEEELPTELTLDDIVPININTAGIEELILLPNVNEQIAQDIITLREKLHGFSHVYELFYVEKLEQKDITEMEKFVTVGQ